MSVEIKGSKKVSKKLKLDINKISSKATKQSVLDFDQRAVKNITERIYQKPPSENYKRTGRARTGRKIKTGRDVNHIMDSRFAGASRGYTAALNKNKRIKKLNTRFHDDAVKEWRKNQTTSKLAAKQIREIWQA